jgi:hypothetical protein
MFCQKWSKLYHLTILVVGTLMRPNSTNLNNTLSFRAILPYFLDSIFFRFFFSFFIYLWGCLRIDVERCVATGKETAHETLITKTAIYVIPEVFPHISFVKNVFTCDIVQSTRQRLETWIYEAVLHVIWTNNLRRTDGFHFYACAHSCLSKHSYN